MYRFVNKSSGPLSVPLPGSGLDNSIDDGIRGSIYYTLTEDEETRALVRYLVDKGLDLNEGSLLFNQS